MVARRVPEPFQRRAVVPALMSAFAALGLAYLNYLWMHSAVAHPAMMDSTPPLTAGIIGFFLFWPTWIACHQFAKAMLIARAYREEFRRLIGTRSSGVNIPIKPGFIMAAGLTTLAWLIAISS